MRKVKLLSTVAAIMMLGGGFAVAQTMHEGQSNGKTERAPAAQRNAPAEKMAPSMHSQRKSSETTGQASSEQGQGKESGRGATMHNQQGAEQNKSRQSGQAGMEHQNRSAQERNQRNEHNGRAENERTREHNGRAENERTHERNGRAENQRTRERNGRAENERTQHNERARGSETHRTTTGQGAASVHLSSEQRTKITSIFREHRVAPAHVNFSVHVGARVPTSVHLYPIPTEVVDVYPEWRGYEYILVGDEILVIDPDSLEVVAILNV